jgi:hypothetical protein
MDMDMGVAMDMDVSMGMDMTVPDHDGGHRK